MILTPQTPLRCGAKCDVQYAARAADVAEEATMRTRLGITVSLVILAITGGVLMTTAASGQTVVHVVFGPPEDMRVAVFDLHRDGLRLGDRIASRGPLLDESQTDRVGASLESGPGQ